MDLHQLVQQFDPFMDQSGEPYIQVSVEGEADIHQIPLDSPLAGSIIRSQLARVVKDGIPTDHQTKAVIEIIRGEAYVRVRRVATCSVDYQIARKPLAEAILAVSRKGGTKKTLPSLLSLFIRTAEREGIDMKKGPWPRTVDALGRQLSQLVPLLAAKGVQLTRHNERPRTWSISPLIGGSDEIDAEVTGSKSYEDVTSINGDTSRPPMAPIDGEPGEFGLSDEEIEHMLKGVLS